MTEPTAVADSGRAEFKMAPTFHELGCLGRPIRDGHRHLVMVDSAHILPPDDQGPATAAGDRAHDLLQPL